jgi:LacI family transcriptional regulator
MITGPLALLNARMRLEGYKRAFAEQGVPVEKQLIYEGRFDIDSGSEATKAFLKASLRPSAIFAANAQMATGVLQAFRDSGIRCPEDIALVSFGDVDWFELVHPRISAVRLPTYDLGATGAEILVKRMTGKLNGPPQHKYLPNKLFIRGSSVGNRGR